ncbi:MAG TPA: pyrroloquinoline quinone biosynthesis protein PqqE [Gemmatimonadaceae bacterium]|nr:pyrroloquinoline quinone biosynthesis protein PqqE [Gemmatimonadaceae bacterium]
MAPGNPTTLLAELTHRCPLHCPYCSNPLELTRAHRELSTEEWMRVFTEARALGVLQLGLSGGEPLVRRDLEQLIAHATQLGLYSTLVTSGLGLTRPRAARLHDAGIDHIQISIQDAERESAERIAGTRSWDAKMAAAALVKELGVAFTVNVVLHRANLDRLETIIDLAATLGADRLELANTQYYGWAMANRDALMPTRTQVEASEAIVDRAAERYRGRMRIIYVLPDYYAAYPKACYGGWGKHYIMIAPDGRALPCHAASQVTTLTFDRVTEHPLDWIWRESPAFQAFRGDAWMQEPCRSCPRKHVDFGGCRCQAFALTGDATRADPVCIRTDDRAIVDAALAHVEAGMEYRYRTMGRGPGQGERQVRTDREQPPNGAVVQPLSSAAAGASPAVDPRSGTASPLRTRA